MISLTFRQVFETALWIQICHKKIIDIEFSQGGTRLHFPAQRSLALQCAVSPGTMIAVLYEMENQGLIKKEERLGIWTTPWGNRVAADIIKRQYWKEARAIVGNKTLETLLALMRSAQRGHLADQPAGIDPKEASSGEAMSHVPVDRKILNPMSCSCCRTTFYTNDRRRRYCDRCKDLSAREKNKARVGGRVRKYGRLSG